MARARVNVGGYHRAMDSPRRGPEAATPCREPPPRPTTARAGRRSSRSTTTASPTRATRLRHRGRRGQPEVPRPARRRRTRSSPTARWARCCSPTASSSAIRPRSGTSTQPEVIRRIQRGYLEAGSQIILTNTFGGQPAAARAARARERGRRAEPDRRDPARAEVDAAGGTALVAGDIGPTRRDRRSRLGTLDYEIAVDVFREQAASLVAGGVDLIWIETMSDLNEIKAAIEGVRRAAPGIALVATMTFDTRGHTMMGVSPGAGGRGARRVGRRRRRRQLRQRPGRAASRSSSRCMPPSRTSSSSPSRTPGCPSSSTCAPSTAPTPPTMADVRRRRCAMRAPRIVGALLRQHARPPARDARRARRRAAA